MISDYEDAYSDWYASIYDIPPSILDLDLDNSCNESSETDVSSGSDSYPLYDQEMPLA